MSMFATSLPLLFAIALTDREGFGELNDSQPLVRIEQQQTAPTHSSNNGETKKVQRADCSISPQKCVRQLLYTPPRNLFPVVLF